MDIFRTPGSTLLGNDKIQFDEVKELVEKGTSDFLVKADWESNIACVDKINSLVGSNTLPEVVFLFRRRLGVRDARLVVLMLHLIESLVKNCGSRFHNAINEDKFMKEMANVTRRFAGKTTEGCRESGDLALDLIQAWGEAFSSRQSQYHFIVKTYLELKKDGAHFKEHDPERMPILTEGIPRATPKHNSQADADAILAAKMQLELNTSAKSIPDNLASVSEDEFSSSFFNSSVYQGHESGKMTGSPKKTVQKRPTPQQQQHHQQPVATHRKENLRKDSFDPSMYPDYDFGDTKPAPAPTHHQHHHHHQQQRPAPTAKQTSLSKRDSFDPSQYPDYDFDDVGHPAVSSAAAPKKKAPPVLNKRSSFDPSQYPDHNFNDDSHALAPEIPVSVDRVDSVTADEVIQSFTFSLSILKDLILACTHERELRGNEVALEIVQQVAAMEGKMNDFIEHALIHETERVEQLFTLNEDAQTMLNVFNTLVSGSMSLAVGKGKLTAKSTSHVPVAKKQVAVDREEHKSHLCEEHKSNHPVHHQHQQQYSQPAPNREHTMQIAHQQNSQRQQAPPQQQATFVRPPMINTSSSSKPIKIKNDSIYGTGSSEAATEDIIELDVNCMTSPQALDALFEDPAVLKARGTPIGIHITTEPVKFDPFSPDALDALFDKPVAKVSPRAAHATPRAGQATPRGSIASASPAAPKEFDPFSPDALDALFDTPPPPVAATHVSNGQTPRHHLPPPVPGHHSHQQAVPQSGYPPQYAQPHQQYPPQHHQHPPTHPNHASTSYAQYSDPHHPTHHQPQYHSAPLTPRNPSPSNARPAPHGQPEYGAVYQQHPSQNYAPQHHSAPQTPRNPSPGSARPSQTPHGSSPQDPYYAQYSSSSARPAAYDHQDPHYNAQYQQHQQHQSQQQQDPRSAPRTPRGQAPQAALHGPQPVDPHYAYQQQHYAPPPHHQQYSDPHHAAPYQQHPAHYPPQQYGAPPPSHSSQYPPTPQNGAYSGYPPPGQQQHYQQHGLKSNNVDRDEQAYYENN